MRATGVLLMLAAVKSCAFRLPLNTLVFPWGTGVALLSLCVLSRTCTETDFNVDLYLAELVRMLVQLGTGVLYDFYMWPHSQHSVKDGMRCR